MQAITATMVLKKLLWKIVFLISRYFMLKNVDIKIKGIEHIPKASFIIVSNQDHPWNAPLLWFVMYKHSKKPTHFFAGNFLFTGLRKYALLLIEQIPVQSGLKTLNIQAFKKAGEFLKQDGIVAIFPAPNPMHNTKRVLYRGITKLLQQNNVPYVPIKIIVKEKWKWRSYYDKNFDNVKIYIGKPQKNKLFKKSITKKQANSYAKKIMKTIENVKHNNNYTK